MQLKEQIDEVLTKREEFFRTAGEYREDGSYVVERRAADTTGNSAVFQSFGELKRLFDRLPDRFDADAITRSGITGSRRHMLIRHFVEHPDFPCTLESRNPLRGKKTSEEGGPAMSAPAD